MNKKMKHNYNQAVHQVKKVIKKKNRTLLVLDQKKVKMINRVHLLLQNRVKKIQKSLLVIVLALMMLVSQTMMDS